MSRQFDVSDSWCFWRLLINRGKRWTTCSFIKNPKKPVPLLSLSLVLLKVPNVSLNPHVDLHFFHVCTYLFISRSATQFQPNTAYLQTSCSWPRRCCGSAMDPWALPRTPMLPSYQATPSMAVSMSTQSRTLAMDSNSRSRRSSFAQDVTDTSPSTTQGMVNTAALLILLTFSTLSRFW